MTATARIGSDERRALLALARRSVETALEGTPEVPDPTRFPAPLYSGVFVSLHDADGLRGCIGRLDGFLPLATAIWDTARDAAFLDPRFAPLTVRELPRVRLEISILGAFEPAAADAIVVGTHGVRVVHGGRSALLLPQVARECGWERDGLLDAVCLKAGLAAGTWRDPGADLRRFTAEVFSDLSEPA